MKRFFTWTLAVLSLCAGFASCSDDEEEVIPELIVNTPTLSVAGTGGAFEVPILTSGLALDETVEVSTDVDWVTNLQATSQSFSFEVSKTPLDVESRTATFTLSLSQHAAIKATCTLTQGKNHEEFYIQMDELDGTCALYTVIPSSAQAEGNFISYCFSSEELAQYTSATAVKDAIWAKQAAMSKKYKEQYGLYVTSTLGWRERPGRESTQELVRDLEPGKEYTIVVFGYTGKAYNSAEEMEVNTDLVKYTFVTPEETHEATPTTLDVKVNVRGALFDVDITAAHNEDYIYLFTAKKSSYDDYYSSDEVFIRDIYYYYYSGASYQTIFSSMYKQHYQQTFSKLKNNTEGIVSAVAFDSHMNLLCQPTKATFTVGEPQPSDNVLTITITELQARSVSMKVNGSNNDPFRVLMMDKEDMEYIMSEGQTDEEKGALLAQYVQKNGTKGQGERSKYYSTWPAIDFVVLAVGVAGYSTDEVPTTKVYKQAVTTPEATISSATCAFDIVKAFDSVEFAEVFDYWGWEGYRTTAFTMTQSDNAEKIYVNYEMLGDFQDIQKEFEEAGSSDRFADWVYMNLEIGMIFNKLGTIMTEEGKDQMIFAAAKDKDGNFGPITHYSMECAKLPISPISEISVFNPNGGADTKSIQVPLRAGQSTPQQPEQQTKRQSIGMVKCFAIE